MSSRSAWVTMIYFFAIWVVLAVWIAGMALYRSYVARNEDDMLHLAAGTEKAVSSQASMAEKLSSIDRWGKSLTAFEVVFGLALLSYWLYNAWLDSVR